MATRSISRWRSRSRPPAIVQGNYGDVNGAAPGGIVSVVDADPRIISNPIVDMTAGNPAAVEDALKYLVFTGAITEMIAAAPVIAAAYAQPFRRGPPPPP